MFFQPFYVLWRKNFFNNIHQRIFPNCKVSMKLKKKNNKSLRIVINLICIQWKWKYFQVWLNVISKHAVTSVWRKKIFLVNMAICLLVHFAICNVGIFFYKRIRVTCAVTSTYIINLQWCLQNISTDASKLSFRSLITKDNIHWKICKLLRKSGNRGQWSLKF